MKRSTGSLVLFLFVYSVVGLCQNTISDSYKPTLDRLNSLTHQPESQWRFHQDVPHPEDPGLNDSDWGVFRVQNVSGPGGQHVSEEHWNGSRVFRRWIQIPEKINGYASEGSRVNVRDILCAAKYHRVIA